MEEPPLLKTRNVALDGVRGLAALSVALGHCVLLVAGLDVWSMTIADLPRMSAEMLVERALMVVLPSNAAVMIFFVLSGHVLWASFSRKQTRLARLADYVNARLFRLLPLIVVTTVAIALVQRPPLSETLANMVLLSTSLNGVTWSLQVEMIGSALIFAVWLFARDDPRKLAAALCAVAAMVPWARGTPLVYMPAFLLGAMIHHAPARLWESRALLWLGLAVLFLPNVYFSYRGVTQVFEILAATLVIGCVGGQRIAALESRAVHFLGSISYPFYLAHPLAVAVVTALIGGMLGGFGFFWKILAYAVSSVSLGILLAWMLHITVEMPAMRIRPRFFMRPARAKSSADGPQ